MDGAPDFVPDFAFDEGFYVSHHADLAAMVAGGGRFDARRHFADHGIAEGRAASVYFDIAYVQARLRRFEEIEVERAGVMAAFFALPPERRFVPNRWFNPWLLRRRHGAQHPSLITMDDYAAFAFYAEHGGAERLSPNGLFDEARYCGRHAAVAEAVAEGRFRSGFHHFVSLGWSKGCENLPDFGAGLIAPDAVGAAERDCVLHVPSDPGRDLGRVVWWFDAAFYLATNPAAHALVRRGAVRSGLEHFLALGLAERRVPHPAIADLVAGDSDAFFAALRARAPGRRAPPLPLPLGAASALARRIGARGEVTDARAIPDAIWPLVTPPAIGGRFDAARYLAVNPDLAAEHASGHLDDPARHWRERGIATQRWAPGSDVFADRTLGLEDLVGGERGVNFFGPLSLDNGLGAAARGTRDALLRAGIGVDAYDISGFVRPGAGFDLFGPEDLRSAFNLIFLNPDQALPLVARYGTEMFDRRATIGFWVWELPTPRPEWRAAIGGFDLIVAPSRYCADAFATATGRAIETIPYVVDRAALHAARDAYAGHPAIDRLIAARDAGRRIVLFVMDASSYTARKGVDVFEAIASAFERQYPGRATFVLKTHSRDRSRPFPTLEPSIVVIDELLDWPALCKLKSIADVLLSPHRSEGFGLNIFEAILLGVPAFCSRHAGATDLLGAEYPYFLDGTLAEVGADLGPYRRGAIWFEPDPAAAVAALARHLDAPGTGRETFEAIAERLAVTLSPDAVGARLAAMLRERLGFGHDLSPAVATLRARRPEGFEIGPSPVAEAQPAGARAALAAAISPDFSIVTPTFNTDPEWLAELHADLCAQTDPSWEWCINDDGSTDPRTRAALVDLRARDARIRVRFAPENLGIARATNAAVGLSSGTHLVMIDHDDRVAPDLLAQYRAAIAAAPEPALLYCDEDKLYPGGERRAHFYKPDFSPEYLMSAMYVLHCLCVPKSLFLSLGGYRSEYDGAQDHDFVLRLVARGTAVRHVDRLLYHWRAIEGSAAASSSAKSYAIDVGRRAVADHAIRIGLDATVEHGLAPGTYRVRPRIRPGRVSLNILTGCAAGRIGERREVYVENFIRSIVRHDTGIDYEIRVIVDAGAEDAAAALPLLDERVSLVPYDRG
ncbi:MAG TPA: glycosyltransferase, partial [Acetobacteraceae bacterium]|nr:glycosyltransferase [Acetobacteraceae bacterium]